MGTTRRFSWGIILCKLKDRPAEPFPRSYFEELFLGQGSGSLCDYWRTSSYGNIDMSFSRVFGWITLSKTLAEYMAIKERKDKIDRCIVELPRDDLAALGGLDGVIAVLNVNVGDSGSVPGAPRVLLDGDAWPKPTFIAHEMGHGLGLPHSFDVRTTIWDPNSKFPGEYGDSRDIMSAMTFANLPATFEGRFGASGPGVSGLSRAVQGWMPERRIGLLHRAPRETWSSEILLAPVDDTAQRWNLLYKLSAEGDHQGHPLPPITYTMEYRPSRGWDSGIPSACIVFHAVYESGPARILWSPAGTQDWYSGATFYDLARKIAIDVGNLAENAARLFVRARDDARPHRISVRQTLSSRYDLSRGLRRIQVGPPFPANSVRGMLLDNPPQIGVP